MKRLIKSIMLVLIMIIFVSCKKEDENIEVNIERKEVLEQDEDIDNSEEIVDENELTEEEISSEESEEQKNLKEDEKNINYNKVNANKENPQKSTESKKVAENNTIAPKLETNPSKSSSPSTAPSQPKPTPNIAPPQSPPQTQSPHITIKGRGISGEFKLSLDELKSMNKQTIRYTGRNKEYNNERQTFTMEGVTVADVLKRANADLSSSRIRVRSTDGFTKTLRLKELLNGEYTYADSPEGRQVPAMIAFKENGQFYNASKGNPFRIVTGQADYDSDDAKDFNMQNWASFLQEIVVE